MVSKLATLPLLYQPGTTFEYGMSTDVLARVVEVVSGMEIDAFLAERICGPLGMRDTAFELPPEKHDRLAEALQWPSAIEPIIYTPAKPQRKTISNSARCCSAAERSAARVCSPARPLP